MRKKPYQPPPGREARLGNSIKIQHYKPGLASAIIMEHRRLIKRGLDLNAMTHPEPNRQYCCLACLATWGIRTSQESLCCPVCLSSNVFLAYTPRAGEPGGPTIKEAEK